MTDVRLDDTAKLFIRDCARRTIRLFANEPDLLDAAEYREKRAQVMKDHDLTEDQDFIFVEITVQDPSEFATVLDVTGHVAHQRHRVLKMESATVPNALAALLLHLRDDTGRQPHIYFEWTEGHPAVNLFRFLAIRGSGSWGRSLVKSSVEPNQTAPSDPTCTLAETHTPSCHESGHLSQNDPKQRSALANTTGQRPATAESPQALSWWMCIAVDEEPAHCCGPGSATTWDGKLVAP